MYRYMLNQTFFLLTICMFEFFLIMPADGGEEKSQMPDSFVPPVIGSYQEFIAFTLPKSGTNLIDEVFRLYLNRNQSYFSLGQAYAHSKNECLLWQEHLKSEGLYPITHDGWNGETEAVLDACGHRIFFLIRDPRDVLISFVNWLDKGRGLSWVDPQENWWKSKTFEEKITYVIRDIQLFPSAPHVKGFRGHFLFRVGWFRAPQVCNVRFENLVGSQGGGDNDLQLKELRMILGHIGIEDSDETIAVLGGRLFGQSGTFNVGQLGRWKGYFTEEHVQLTKDNFGEFILEFGYENDENWNNPNL